MKRRERDRDLDDEIASHFRLAVEDRVRSGESVSSALAATHREFGSEALVKEITREMWKGAWIERLMHDVRIALRSLRRTPRFSLVAILCIAVGVAVTATIFSALHGILLRPLPYPNAQQLIVLRATKPEGGLDRTPFTRGEVEAWRSARSLRAVAAWRTGWSDLTGSEDVPERVTNAAIDASLFPALGVKPLIGRWLRPAEQQESESNVIVLSHQLWRSRFGADRTLIGKKIRVGDREKEVVGVMPPTFSFPEGALTWTPLVSARVPVGHNPYFNGLIGWLADGVGLEQARLELKLQLREVKRPADHTGPNLNAITLREALLGALRKPVVIFQAAALLVLIIACANVAALMLARANAREQELALRAAIGAGRHRLIMHVLIECLTLAMPGGFAGVALAYCGVRLLTLAFPDGVPSYLTLTIDPLVLGVTLLITVLAALGFGLAPALRAASTRATATLKNSPRSPGFTEWHQTRNAVIIAEIALSVILITAAQLLVRSHRNLEGSLGLRPEGVLSVRVPLGSRDYGNDEKRAAFFQDLSDRLKRLPRVVDVSSTITSLPLDGVTGGPSHFRWEGQAPRSREITTQVVNGQYIAPGLFRTLGVPLLAGRDVSRTDQRTDEYAAVVNEAFAGLYFSTSGVLGQRFTVVTPDDTTESRPLRIVGVVQDFRHERPPAPIMPTFYMFDPFAYPSQTIVIRTTLAEPLALAPRIRALVHAIDSRIVLTKVQSLTGLVERAFWRERLQASVLSIFSVIAVLLAVFGMYGVVSYAVAQRTGELGIRLALGASRGQVIALVLSQAARLSLVGVTIGAAAAIGLSRVWSGIIYDVRVSDPLVLLVVCSCIVLVGVGAALIPACRAARLDPLVAIRLAP